MNIERSRQRPIFAAVQLSSALWCLTSVFGMGTGVSTTLLSPNSLSKLDILVFIR